MQWLTVQNLWQHLEEVFSHSGTAKVKIDFEVPEATVLISHSHPCGPCIIERPRIRRGN